MCLANGVSAVSFCVCMLPCDGSRSELVVKKSRVSITHTAMNFACSMGYSDTTTRMDRHVTMPKRTHSRGTGNLVILFSTFYSDCHVLMNKDEYTYRWG